MSGRNVQARQTPKFQFIISKGPQTVEDPKVRTLIRRQAMRDIGLSRRRNRGIRDQTDLDRESDSSPVETSSSSSSAPTAVFTPSNSVPGYLSGESWESSEDIIDQTALVASQWPKMSSPITFSFQSGYEKVRSRFCIDISNLSVLTSFGIGRAQIALLSSNPQRLASLFEFQQWSYLEYIPARYDHSPCLAAATDCVMAKVVSVLFPNQKQGRPVWSLYAKALRSIQDAISCPESSSEPDLLCAIKLLSLHEVRYVSTADFDTQLMFLSAKLLDASREEAWCQHINGSARLIMHRSPAKFTTDFEKALLITHAGPLVSETMIANEHCYLAEPQWASLLYSMVEDTDELTEMSPLALNIRVKMLSLPGLWHDIGQLINSEKLFDDKSLQQMVDRCAEMHADYVRWLDDYNAHCVRKSFVQVPPSELELRREMFGTVCECFILVKRLWACLADDQRLQLEIEVQALSKLILELQEQGGPKLSWLFSVHEIQMARTTFLTEHLFEEGSKGLSNFEMKLASRRRYNLYSNCLRGSSLDGGIRD